MWQRLIPWIQGKWTEMLPQSAPEDYIKLFTDGACSGNPGPGGWAFIMEHPATGKRIERAGAEPHTTNNRMEIISALKGLETLKRSCRVEIITDSQYLAKGMMEWLPNWRANGYQRREGKDLKPLKNDDLWRAVDEQLRRHEIKVTHVKGHAGHPENERCDQMAVAAYKRLMAGALAPNPPEPIRQSERPQAWTPAARVRPVPAASKPPYSLNPTRPAEPEERTAESPDRLPKSFANPEPVQPAAPPPAAARPKSPSAVVPSAEKPTPRAKPPVRKAAPKRAPAPTLNLTPQEPQTPPAATPKRKPAPKTPARKPPAKPTKSQPRSEMPLRWDPDDEVV